MLRTTARRSAVSCALVGTATSLLLAASPPAYAQATAQDLVGATSATALRLTLNLPGGAATKVELVLDPVSGTVSRTTTTAATADATVLRGSLGGQALDTGTSSAMLPSPTSAESNPLGAIEEGLAGTPLANLLKIELLPSSAEVSTAPNSGSDAAVANLGAGLPDALASALAPLTTPLAGAVDQVLTALAEASGTPVAQICAGVTDAVEALDPATSQIDEVLAALPVPVPLQAVIDQTALGALCGLSTTVAQLNTALQDALASLTGDSGVLGTGTITAEQEIVTEGRTVSALAAASIEDLTLLGQTPFANAQVLETASLAKTAGTPGSAVASVDSTIADLQGGFIDPFLQVRTTIQGIRDSFVGEGALPAELATLFDDLFTTLNAALAPVGVTLFKLDDSADAQKIETCPAAIEPTLTGLLEAANGSCAAAATRGVGISVTLPEALAGPLQVGGPLVELQIVPSAAVVRAQARTVDPVDPIEPADPDLPRTGADSALLGGVGVALLAGAAVLRRRRTAGAL